MKKASRAGGKVPKENFNNLTVYDARAKHKRDYTVYDKNNQRGPLPPLRNERNDEDNMNIESSARFKNLLKLIKKHKMLKMLN